MFVVEATENFADEGREENAREVEGDETEEKKICQGCTRDCYYEEWCLLGCYAVWLL
jgi:hypothetical protein